ncbi:GntR family transcriptional regulator [Segeticoccus rhizosphaerae]|jgi:DNA-binding GntR family transcriptional regulator|uniref:GntR family transcriptional regulator n=1 Tax=Segeticoccus rhizosphaerae TaxID=1104777 RepID=UPI0010BFF51B|nr:MULTISPECIES: GntR family transcriptional regulator [Intrasporangiaceae]
MTARRGTVAERAAEILRRRIVEGSLLPGEQLREEHLVGPLGISRNTLREAFRLLAHDGLLVHRLNYGVFVRELGEADLVDVYHMRRLVECGTLRLLPALDPDELASVRESVYDGDVAQRREDWRALGTANMRFHQELVGLGGSPHADEVVRRLLAELRLAFHVVGDARKWHEPYLARNHELLSLLEAGQVEQAADELQRYLRDSEDQLLSAYRADSAHERGHAIVAAPQGIPSR